MHGPWIKKLFAAPLMIALALPATALAAPNATPARPATTTSAQGGIEWFVSGQQAWAKRMGQMAGMWARGALSLNPLVRLNPLMQPARLAQGAQMTASYLSGISLRAHMVGAWPVGAARAVRASYFEGLAAGLEDKAP